MCTRDVAFKTYDQRQAMLLPPDLDELMGKGAEFMTLEPVKVKLINWQLLR